MNNRLKSEIFSEIIEQEYGIYFKVDEKLIDTISYFLSSVEQEHQIDYSETKKEYKDEIDYKSLYNKVLEENNILKQSVANRNNVSSDHIFIENGNVYISEFGIK